MPRREPYSRVVKRGQERPEHVRGQGDVVYKVLQCLAAECQVWIVVRRDDIRPGFQLQCESCLHELRDGEGTGFFDYDLVVEGEVVESAEFVVDHGEYVRGAPDHKYCLLCYTLKPLDAFGRHGSRQSGRQGECTSCKTAYNRIKNKTRISDQHREASERRRLLGFWEVTHPESIGMRYVGNSDTNVSHVTLLLARIMKRLITPYRSDCYGQ